jgi:transcriptional regulator with XRE-family HTH domain
MSVMDISFTIKSLRQAGLTQTQIGNAIGLRQTSISDMESGKAGTKRPSFQVIDGLARLAKKHKVPVEPPAHQPQ